ncbi:hypothetical protein Tco_0626660 [Tanacetum coccineum]|uniref:Uncharacterized protein n=1 Tax=Tanacetum coccineum TaxID=301880 RepID=A0ABQ4WKF0_9ASTR
MFPRKSEGEELEYPFFEGDGSSYDEWRDYVYDTDIEDVIEEEEGFIEKEGFGGKEDNIEDVVVVANDLYSSMIQTTLNVDFDEDINTKSLELVTFAKSIIIKFHSYLHRISSILSSIVDFHYLSFNLLDLYSNGWYTKFFLEQKIAEIRRFVDRIHSEVATSREYITQLNTVVAEFEAMENQE